MTQSDYAQLLGWVPLVVLGTWFDAPVIVQVGFLIGACAILGCGAPRRRRAA